MGACVYNCNFGLCRRDAVWSINDGSQTLLNLVVRYNVRTKCLPVLTSVFGDRVSWDYAKRPHPHPEVTYSLNLASCDQSQKTDRNDCLKEKLRSRLMSLFSNDTSSFLVFSYFSRRPHQLSSLTEQQNLTDSGSKNE